MPGNLRTVDVPTSTFDMSVARHLGRLLGRRLPPWKEGPSPEARRARRIVAAFRNEVLLFFRALGPTQAQELLTRFENKEDPLWIRFTHKLHHKTVEKALQILKQRAALPIGSAQRSAGDVRRGTEDRGLDDRTTEANDLAMAGHRGTEDTSIVGGAGASLAAGFGAGTSTATGKTTEPSTEEAFGLLDGLVVEQIDALLAGGKRLPKAALTVDYKRELRTRIVPLAQRILAEARKYRRMAQEARTEGWKHLRNMQAGARYQALLIILPVLHYQNNLFAVLAYADAAGTPSRVLEGNARQFDMRFESLVTAALTFDVGKMRKAAANAEQDFRVTQEKLNDAIEDIGKNAELSRVVIGVFDILLLAYSFYQVWKTPTVGKPGGSKPPAVGRVYAGGIASVTVTLDQLDEAIKAIRRLIKIGALDAGIIGALGKYGGSTASPIPELGKPQIITMADVEVTPGVRYSPTKKEAEAIGRLQKTLKGGGKWDDLSSRDRKILGSVFHKVTERLAARLYQGIGPIKHLVKITPKLVGDLSKKSTSVLFVEGKLYIKGRWKRVDLLEIDFKNRHATIIDLTSVERVEHVAKTRSYKVAVENLTGFPVKAIESRYVGDGFELLEILLEEIVE